jgi:hypothetical protein
LNKGKGKVDEAREELSNGCKRDHRDDDRACVFSMPKKVPDTNGGSLNNILPILTLQMPVFSKILKVMCLKSIKQLVKEPPFVPDTFLVPD